MTCSRQSFSPVKLRHLCAIQEFACTHNLWLNIIKLITSTLRLHRNKISQQAIPFSAFTHFSYFFQTKR